MTENGDRQRMEQCALIASKIIANWETTKNFQYTLRATDSIGGLELRELRRRKFLLGVGEDLSEVSLGDVLTVFSILEQRGLAEEQLRTSPTGTYSFTAHVPPEFSNAEAVRILSQLRIETPYDEGQVMQIVLGKPPGEAGGQPAAGGAAPS